MWAFAQLSTAALPQSWPSSHSVGVTNENAGTLFGSNDESGTTSVRQKAWSLWVPVESAYEPRKYNAGMCLTAFPLELHAVDAPSTYERGASPARRAWRNTLSARDSHVLDGEQSFRT